MNAFGSIVGCPFGSWREHLSSAPGFSRVKHGSGTRENHCRADILVCWGGTFQFRFGRLESRPNPAMRDWKACATAQIGTRPSILDYAAKTVAEDDSLQSPSRNSMFDVGC
jgi:hypothetical protein